MCATIRRPVLLCAALALCAATAPAEDTYKGDGSRGGLVPDFPQVWSKDQKVAGLSAAAAAAAALWWLDQHSYPELVRITDRDNPNRNWRTDSKALFDELANLIYGPKFTAGSDPDAKAQGRNDEAALTKYIANHRWAPGQRGAKGLAVRNYNTTYAKYKNWVESTKDDKRAVITRAYWKDRNGDPVKHNGMVIQHALCSAGLDSEKKKLLVTHGWGDHPGTGRPTRSLHTKKVRCPSLWRIMRNSRKRMAASTS